MISVSHKIQRYVFDTGVEFIRVGLGNRRPGMRHLLLDTACFGKHALMIDGQRHESVRLLQGPWRR